MKAISFAGFTGFVDRYVNDTSSYASGRVLMVSIYGQLTAVRAIASALVLRENRKWNNGVTLNDRSCYLESGASYRAITQRSDRRAFGVPTRITLIHERCTIKMINDPLFYILSPGKLSNLEENARERLRIASHLAITAEDAAWLWQDGQSQNTEFLGDDDRYFRQGALITEIEAPVAGIAMGLLTGKDERPALPRLPLRVHSGSPTRTHLPGKADRTV